jgi:general stress protein CsbA
MSKNVNIILIIILVCVTAWSIYVGNWYILVANVCIISGVMIDDKTQKMLKQENYNAKLVKGLKSLVTILYVIGAIALIILGFSKY